MRLCTSRRRDSVGLSSRSPVVGRVLLPTKTSLLLIQSFGRSHSFLRACSHVPFIKDKNILFFLIFVAVTLSSVSLAFICLSHLDLLLFLLANWLSDG